MPKKTDIVGIALIGLVALMAFLALSGMRLEDLFGTKQQGIFIKPTVYFEDGTVYTPPIFSANKIYTIHILNDPYIDPNLAVDYIRFEIYGALTYSGTINQIVAGGTNEFFIDGITKGSYADPWLVPPELDPTLDYEDASGKHSTYKLGHQDVYHDYLELEILDYNTPHVIRYEVDATVNVEFTEDPGQWDLESGLAYGEVTVERRLTGQIKALTIAIGYIPY